MTRRPRRNHSPAFKAKVALAAIRGEQTWRNCRSNSTCRTGRVCLRHWHLAILESRESRWSDEHIAATLNRMGDCPRQDLGGKARRLNTARVEFACPTSCPARSVPD
ncbi:hypothetical protein C7U62_22385 [Mesorhizobium loti]|nr:hypothetical protein [Sinorhizobium meliloti]MDX0371612.1 hypothetical protein [Sinorhizobium meliloti]PST20813.1 hypothetical protein C7U62_22385 [Mesorhizobium loti]RVO68488.1 hypothetical protein CN091_33190 [Sinorhizobium meliloti]RVP16817.1 hypothetical protein CN109_25520 [Sinorhizobium meliloti]